MLNFANLQDYFYLKIQFSFRSLGGGEVRMDNEMLSVPRNRKFSKKILQLNRIFLPEGNFE